jgi:hypothetical protein
MILGGSATAGQYRCEFQKDAAAIHSCQINSSGNANCNFNFPGTNMQGSCGVAPLSNTADILVCAIRVPGATATSIVEGLPHDIGGATRALAQKPGFVAAGVTLGPAGQIVIGGAYKEKDNTPTLAGVCQP